MKKISKLGWGQFYVKFINFHVKFLNLWETLFPMFGREFIGFGRREGISPIWLWNTTLADKFSCKQGTHSSV